MKFLLPIVFFAFVSSTFASESKKHARVFEKVETNCSFANNHSGVIQRFKQISQGEGSRVFRDTAINTIKLSSEIDQSCVSNFANIELNILL